MEVNINIVMQMKLDSPYEKNYNHFGTLESVFYFTLFTLFEKSEILKRHFSQ